MNSTNDNAVGNEGVDYNFVGTPEELDSTMCATHGLAGVRSSLMSIAISAEVIAQNKLDRGIITQDEFEAVVYSHRAAFAAVEFEPSASDSHTAAPSSNQKARVNPSPMPGISVSAIGEGEGLAGDSESSIQSPSGTTSTAALTPIMGESRARIVATGRTLGNGTVILLSVVAGYLYQMTGSTAPAVLENKGGGANTVPEVEEEGRAIGGGTDTSRTNSTTSSLNGEGASKFIGIFLGSNAEQATLRGAPLGFVGSLFLLEVSDASSSSVHEADVASVFDVPPGARLLWARYSNVTTLKDALVHAAAKSDAALRLNAETALTQLPPLPGKLLLHTSSALDKREAALSSWCAAVAAVATQDASVVDGSQWPLRTIWEDWCRTLPVCQPGNVTGESENEAVGPKVGTSSTGNVEFSPTSTNAPANTNGSSDIVNSSDTLNVILGNTVEDLIEAELAEDSESDDEHESLSENDHGSIGVDEGSTGSEFALEAVLVEDDTLTTSALAYSSVIDTKEGTASDDKVDVECRRKTTNQASSPKSAMKATSSPDGDRTAQSASPKVVRFGEADGNSSGHSRSGSDGSSCGGRASARVGGFKSDIDSTATQTLKANGPVRIERRSTKQIASRARTSYVAEKAVASTNRRKPKAWAITGAQSTSFPERRAHVPTPAETSLPPPSPRRVPHSSAPVAPSKSASAAALPQASENANLPSQTGPVVPSRSIAL